MGTNCHMSQRLREGCRPNACNMNINLALSARAACIPDAIVATALPTMPRKHADVDYNVAMLQEIGRAAAKREEDAAREQGELVRVTCRYFPAP